MKSIPVVIAMIASACTSLGPMPATTGVSAIPAARPGVEGQLGIMPGYRLSSGATASPQGASISQAAVLIEPDHWIHVPGLIIGGRVFGNSGDSPAEPLVGYRHKLGDDVAVAIVGYGTVASATSNGASYKAKRLGGEASIDARVIPIASWLSLHAQAAAALTHVSATGSYCVDASGVGIDCSNDGPNTFVDAKLSGSFPSGTGSLSLDAGHLENSWFHSARLAFLGSAGTMPTLSNGVQRGSHSYASAGLSLTLAIGE